MNAKANDALLASRRGLPAVGDRAIYIRQYGAYQPRQNVPCHVHKLHRSGRATIVVDGTGIMLTVWADNLKPVKEG